LVRDVRPGAEGSRITQIFAGPERLYFLADDGARGREIWSSDGTVAHTQRRTDLWPGVADSNPSGLAPSSDGEWLYFTAWTESTWQEPWRLKARPFLFADGFESGDTSAWSGEIIQ
ncbi:MAG: hypothetical protein KDD47_20705, partial [Acidobacteria bacterium]|nr:hypothetical protein [Acidobacteriota bacterium]